MGESQEKAYRGMGVFRRPEDEILGDGRIVLKDRDFLGSMLKVGEEIDLENDGGKTKVRILEIRPGNSNKSDIVVEPI